MKRRIWVTTAIVLLTCLAVACGAEPEPAPDAEAAGSDALVARADEIDAAVAAWEAAESLTAAQAFAEQARNLVVGPDGPYYGDADGDGTVMGETTVGLLPGLDGSAGLASAAVGGCLDANVLGGSWAEPDRRWAELDAAILSWSPTNNPFPKLPSHPQRIVGWATLTLDTDDLAVALEFAGHARLHIDVTSADIAAC